MTAVSRNGEESSQGSAHTQPVDVPRLFHPEDVLTSLDSTSYLGVFAGSPDNIDTTGDRFHHHRPRDTPPHLRRIFTEVDGTKPFLGSRNVSSPLVERIPRSEHRGGAAQSSAIDHVRQWTVFGQLMENEGQMPSSYRPRSTSRHRRMSLNRPRHSYAASPSIPATPRQNGSSRAASFMSPLDANGTHHLASQTPTTQDQPATFGDEYDSDESETSTEGESTPTTTDVPQPTSPSRKPTISTLYKNVLKCSIAYFIASLFTFTPFLSGLISDMSTYGPGHRGPSPSGHMVATIAVYFNPAKTMGGMLEADFFCFVGLFYSAFVCLASMSMFWWLELKPGWEWLGDVVAILWIGLSMSGLAWMKVWMANPSFNTACSMTSIIIFVVLVKEGGLQTLLQVTTIVVFGSLVSNLVCYIIWPQSATSALQQNMVKTLDSYSTLLSTLTKVFLMEHGKGMHHTGLEKVQEAAERHQSSFTSLKKNLKEAKSEWFNVGDGQDSLVVEVGSKGNSLPGAYEDAIDIMNRLAQHLNGLRSGTRLQYELTKAGAVRVKNAKRRRSKALLLDDQVLEDEDAGMLKAAAIMFGDLVEELGPPLTALSNTCNVTFCRLREAFHSSTQHSATTAVQPQEFSELVDGIEHALFRFESTSNHAVLRLYRKSDIIASLHSSISNLDSHGSVYSERTEDKEHNIFTNGDHEHVFLVYFFIFTLQEFSRELISLVDAMGRIYFYEQQRRLRGRLFYRLTHRLRTLFRPRKPADKNVRKPGLRRTISSFMIPEHRMAHPAFPKIRPHAPDTLQTPPWRELSYIGKAKQTIWAIGKRMGERDTKFAIKAGMAIALLAAPAFFDLTRPYFIDNFGDWALISFFVVISPTIGATNYLSLQRVLGTLFGAAVAAAIYAAFPENAIVLSIFGFFFSLPCSYFAVSKPQYISASRFVLLTYNLTCLYCYNLRQKDVSVSDIAIHRALAVTIGVLWAALVSRFWWPSEARRELSKGLGEFCLNIGWLYTRLVASNSFAPEYNQATNPENDRSQEESAVVATRARTTRLYNSIHEFMAMELHLQIKLIELQGLLAQAQHEPRLKGPFPVNLYRGILTSLQIILDKLHSMRCVTTKEEWYTSVRQEFIIPVNKERREMVGNIILSFSTLASAFRLKAPLPPYLPPAESSRQKLVDAIRRLEVVRNREVKGSRQLLFFAYALTMKGVTQELEHLGRTLQEAFGVIGQSSQEFEALFVDSPETRTIIDNVA